MKHIKLFEEMDWDAYGKKRELIMDILPDCIDRASKFKDKIETYAWYFRSNFLGAYLGQVIRENGYDRNLPSAIYNKIDSLDYHLGPNMAGEFVATKANFLQKLLGKGGIGIQGDSSICGILMNSIGEDGKKELTKREIGKLADELWKLHPNNPENKLPEKEEGEYTFDDAVEDAIKGMKDEDTNESYEDEMSRVIIKMKKGKEILERLKNEVNLLRTYIISKVEGKIEQQYIDLLKNKFDLILHAIGPDNIEVKKKSFFDKFKKEEEKTTKDYSVLTLIDKFLNKETVKYWF